MHKALSIATAFCLTVWSGSGTAATIETWKFTLEGGDGPLSGTLSLDGSLRAPNTFISFDALSSFTFTGSGQSFDLGDALYSTEGIVTNSAGKITSFHDLDTSLVSVLLRNDQADLIIHESNGSWRIALTGGSDLAAGSSHSFVLTPVPAALPLLATGVGLLFALGRKRRASRGDVAARAEAST